MFRILNILLIFSFLLLNSCKSSTKEVSNIKEKSQELEIVNSYNEAYEYLNGNDVYLASKKFLETELLFPQSKWAPKSALMASYSFYLQNYYSEAISNLERYLQTYPSHNDKVYAHYLIAICYFEMIEDEKRDYEPIINSKNKFNYIIENYPETDFAVDARFKINLIQDVLASKEMYLGRHYQKKQKWIPAINRLKTVVNNYDETIFIEEALHRLVEIYYKIGLVDESMKYAQLLGYNYLSSEWYKKTYKVFNQDYQLLEIDKNKSKESVLKRFKKIF